MKKPYNKKYLATITLAVALCLTILFCVYTQPANAATTGNLGSFVMPQSGVATSINYDLTITVDSYNNELFALSLKDMSNNVLGYGTFYADGQGSPEQHSGTFSINTFLLSGTTYQLVLEAAVSFSVSGSADISYTPWYQISASSSFGYSIDSAYHASDGNYYVEQGASVTVSVSSPYAYGSGIQYVCSGYSIDGGSAQAGTSYTFTNMQAAHSISFNWQLQYQVTYSATGLDATAQGTIVTVDGSAKAYGALPFTQWVNSGASTTFTYGSTITSSTTGKQFRLSSSVSSPQTITGPTTITDGYSTYYYLTVSSTYGTPLYADWYLAGSTAYCGITPTTVSGGTGIQYVFTGWTGSGSGSYTGVLATGTVTMNGPITETATWGTQYYLDVQGVYSTTTGSGWYNAGATAHFNVSSPVGSLAFKNWVGTGTGSYSGTTQYSSVTMNNPITETAGWSSQYYLTVISAYGTTTGSGFYESGATAYAGLTSGSVSGGSGIQYNFVSWSVGGTNYSQSAPITMTSDLTVTATWSTQYYLTVNSAYGLPTSGSGWYNAGATAYAAVSTNIDGTHTLQGWTGDASGSSTTSNAITMSAPKTATAAWTGSSTPSGSTDYNVTIYGPYYENGLAASGETVTFQLLFANNSIYQHSLNSSIGTPGSIFIASTSPFTQLTWNASSTSTTLNSTRVYRFANGANGINDTVVNLYILNPSTPAFQYTFSVSDYYGMIDPYLQTSISPDGIHSYVVERYNLNETGGYVTFVMQQYQMYTLTFVCQQGAYSQTFTAQTLGTPGQLPINLNVLAGNFPSSSSSSVIAAYANRTSSTNIIATYIDPTGNTTWVFVQISHKQGSSTIIDYTSPNSTSSIQTFTWSLADSATTYYVTIAAMSDGQLYTYNLIIASEVSSNPWAQIDWGYLGQYIPTLPTTYTGWGGIDPSQMIAAILILLALGIGSYYSTGASCLISWVVGGLLLMMGWWQGSVPLFALAGFFTILILIDEYKKGAFNI